MVGTNPAIANAFAYMKIIEKWGTGIPRIFRECTEYGLPESELIDFDGDFRVNMYRKSLISEKQVIDVTEKVTGIEAKILELISNNIWNSIGLGLAGGFLLLTIQTVLFMIQGKSISFISPQLLNWVIFLFAAFEEEVLFRGYIQTRLSGLISSQWIVGIINSVLFLSIHYPVKWVVSGAVSFDVLSAVYIVSLLALHFFCDAVYKRTNCLWGAVILHIIYNAVGAMIIIQ